MAVYFVEREDGAVKIGFTDAPERRIAQLRREYGKLELLAVIPGSIEVERALHKRFNPDALGAEWFRHSLNLRAFIEQVTFLDGIDDCVRAPTRHESNLGDYRNDLSEQTVELVKRMARLIAPSLHQAEALQILAAETGLPVGRFENALRRRLGASLLETNILLRQMASRVLTEELSRLQQDLDALNAMEPPRCDEILAASAALRDVRETLDRARGKS